MTLEPILSVKEMLVVRGNILWTVRWPAILLYYSGISTKTAKEELGDHQDNNIKEQ